MDIINYILFPNIKRFEDQAMLKKWRKINTYIRTQLVVHFNSKREYFHK